MDGCKIYVDVNARFTKDGSMMPTSMIWTDGHVYTIQRVTDVRWAASFRAAAVGLRYTCIIDGRESHLFYEDNNKWFVERRYFE